MKTYTSETLTVPAVSHSCVSSINILIVAQRYLSGVKRKISVAAASVICSVFGPGEGRPRSSQGRHTKAKQYIPRKHGWNLAQGQMGILSTRGVWNVFFVGGNVLYVLKGGGGVSELGPNSPQRSLAERCISNVNMW